MRVFFAVEFNDDIKKYIKAIQSVIKENSVKGNFSHEENFHLTLKFIGEVGEKELSKLKYSLDKAVKQIKPFSITFNRLGFFTKESRKIVWIGLRNKDKSLEKLYSSIEECLYESGFPKDSREYSPHITLSRETLFKAGFEEQLRKIAVDFNEIKINKVSLMESARINGKLTYRALYVKEF